MSTMAMEWMIYETNKEERIGLVHEWVEGAERWVQIITYDEVI